MKKHLIAALALLLVAPAVQAGPDDAELPSISTTQTMKMTAQVVAIDREKKEVTLRGPGGDENTLELPEAQRSTVELVYVQGFKYSEAARILDVPIGTVMSRLAAAREKLMSEFGQESKVG